jgi:hypothetical protein
VEVWEVRNMDLKPAIEVVCTAGKVRRGSSPIRQRSKAATERWRCENVEMNGGMNWAAELSCDAGELQTTSAVGLMARKRRQNGSRASRIKAALG